MHDVACDVVSCCACSNMYDSSTIRWGLLFPDHPEPVSFGGYAVPDVYVLNALKLAYKHL